MRSNYSFQPTRSVRSAQLNASVRPQGRFMHRRRTRVGVFVLMFGLFPLLNAIGNPRVQTLHGSDVVAIIDRGIVLWIRLGAAAEQAHVSRRVIRHHSQPKQSVTE
jgi:hypothetical protein